jgi:hypothetical protein
MPQHNGTAVHSLASEHLQELEGLVGSKRQKQEEVVSVAMGSIYHGEALYSRIRVYGTYKTSFQPVQTRCVFLDNHTCFIVHTDSDIRDYIGDALPLSSPSPLPTCTKTSAGGTRCCNRKGQITHVR